MSTRESDVFTPERFEGPSISNNQSASFTAEDWRSIQQTSTAATSGSLPQLTIDGLDVPKNPGSPDSASGLPADNFDLVQIGQPSSTVAEAAARLAKALDPAVPSAKPGPSESSPKIELGHASRGNRPNEPAPTLTVRDTERGKNIVVPLPLKPGEIGKLYEQGGRILCETKSGKFELNRYSTLLRDSYAFKEVK